jgi:hypothetical protein
MGLTLVLKAHILVYITYVDILNINNLSMYKFRPSFLWQVSMLYTFSCMLVAHTTVWLKIIQY